MKTTGDAANTGTEAGSTVVKTYGELFPDGSVLDVVSSATGGKPQLIFSNGKSTFIDTQITYGGRTYEVQELQASILQATRLPPKPLGYGTIEQLFNRVGGDLRAQFGFLEPSGEGDYLLGFNYLVL